jgi:dipeptidyl-peptidase 9
LEVDVDRELVYFVGSKDTPLEHHLYVASFAKGANPHNVHRWVVCDENVLIMLSRLTVPGFSHHVKMHLHNGNTVFADKYSNISKCVACDVKPNRIKPGSGEVVST